MTGEREQFAQGIEQAIAQAWVDNEFKALLVQHPDQALSQLGVQVPSHLSVEFADEPGATLGDWSMTGHGQQGTLRIPIPAPPEGALTEDQLAAVGGGKSSCCCCSTITIMCCGA